MDDDSYHIHETEIFPARLFSAAFFLREYHENVEQKQYCGVA